MQIDWEAEGLLDGLDPEARRERTELLEELTSQGVSLEHLKDGAESGMLLFIPAELEVGGVERHTVGDVAEATRLAPEFIVALRRANGLPRPEPDECVFSDADIEAFELAQQALAAGITPEELVELTRILGRGLAQAAEAMRAMTLRLVAQPGQSEAELARRYAGIVKGLGPMAEPLAGHVLRVQLRQMAQSEAADATEQRLGQLPGSREVNIAFADLVGFTRVGEEVPADELGRLAGRLEELAIDLVKPPARLVKTIGDAAMLVSPETDPLLDSTLSLVEAADAEGAGFPQLRAGVAAGTALRRAGDWFGRPVNIASRVTAIARPGSVLVTDPVRSEARDDYSWSFAGERHLKGVRGTERLFRVRRADAG